MVLEKKSKVCERLRNSGDCNNETDRQILIRKLIQLTLSRCMRSLKEKSLYPTVGAVSFVEGSMFLFTLGMLLGFDILRPIC